MEWYCHSLSTNRLWYRKLSASLFCQTHYEDTDKNNKNSFECLYINYHLYLSNASDNVCLDLQHWCYSVCNNLFFTSNCEYDYNVGYFNNISVILWQPVLLMEENEAPKETCQRSVCYFTNFVTLSFISNSTYLFLVNLSKLPVFWGVFYLWFSISFNCGQDMM